MLLLSLWNYIRGYVIIIVEGYYLEKFLNICIHRQIFLWDIKKLKNCKMVLKISINGFKAIRPVAKKTKCRVRILRKKGVPFIVNRYKGRKAFVLGAVVFVTAFYLLISFIWSIELIGNKKIETGFILQRLETFGVKPGVIKYGIDTEKIANGMMLDINELAWIGVSIKGTKLKVEISERVKPPDLVPKQIPCNIIAKRDGVIKNVIAKAGQEKVKEGDTVVKGQVLISGTVDNKDTKIEPRQVHAIGTIKARTWYEKESPVKTKVIEKQRTGRIKDNYSTNIFTKKINLFHNEDTFENYDKIEIKKKISIGEDIVLPFELIIDRYYENQLIEKEIGIDEAQKNAESISYNLAVSEIPENAEIVKIDSSLENKEDGEIYANIVIECIEDIGETQELN